MGKAWQKLHFLVYAAGIAAVIHYIWQTKIGILIPVIYGIVLLLLLIIRLPVVRKYIENHTGNTSTYYIYKVNNSCVSFPVNPDRLTDV